MAENHNESTPFLNQDGQNTGGCSHSDHHLSPADRQAAARRRRLAGPALTFVLGICIFVIATGGASSGVFPGTVGDVSQPELDIIGPIKTWECGTSLLPVLNSSDVVSYFSLEEGEGAVYGTEEHEVVYKGYLFRFESANNKALFEESPLDYIPAWGGFCSYGIALEDGWNPNDLGPHADPDSWYITDDNVLHIFRRYQPRSTFWYTYVAAPQAQSDVLIRRPGCVRAVASSSVEGGVAILFAICCCFETTVILIRGSTAYSQLY
ncbi:unnamed protein product [Pylaiella littoralis]